MSFLPVLHVATTAGALYTACTALAVMMSLIGPTSKHRDEARETLKILLRRKQ
jgi:hypothetical protein